MKSTLETLDSPEAAAVHGAASKPLSREQKQALVMVARKAHERLKALDAGLPAFDVWRAEQSIAACGRRISEAGNADFSAIKARFMSFVPDRGQAFERAMLSETEKSRQGLYKLKEDCAARGLHFPSYPAAIALKQYKCALEDCSPKQIWRLVFTIRSRRKPVVQEPDPF